MKKIIKLTTTALILITFAVSGYGQNKVSIIAGFHSANVSADGINMDFLNLQSINRFTGGISIERKLDKYLSLQTGVFYKQKGFKISEALNINAFELPLPLGVKITSEVNTIDVPLMLKYDFANASKITPFVSVGPNFSYATSGSIKTKATAILDFTLATIPLDLSSDNYNRIGIEGMIAGGINFPYGNGFITTEVNYSHALNDFTSDSFIVDTGIRNRGIGFSIGYGMAF